MAWIKRNLFFLIGTLVAVALMVVGIFYLLAQINEENQVTEDIQKEYAELTRLATLKPHPGNDKIDNIKSAKEQQQTLLEYLKKERNFFQRIAPIPDSSTNKVTNADFARELRNTVAQLRHSAEQQSVKLPPDYYFTFEAQKKTLTFDAGSLERLAGHLGEIKSLCDVLFAAKINYLDSIQREIVSTNQDNNQPDYLATQKTVSTPMADLTPYQVTFRCFSADLAMALANLANSPYGFMVQSINVEPVNAAATMANANPFQPQLPPPPPAVFIPGNPAEPGRRFGGPGFPQPVAPVVAAPAASGRPVPFLIENPFRVTLLIQVVKLKPAK